MKYTIGDIVYVLRQGIGYRGYECVDEMPNEELFYSKRFCEKYAEKAMIVGMTVENNLVSGMVGDTIETTVEYKISVNEQIFSHVTEEYLFTKEEIEKVSFFIKFN